jgi:hypothetical protein
VINSPANFGPDFLQTSQRVLILLYSENSAR